MRRLLLSARRLRFGCAGFSTGAVDEVPISPAMRMPLVWVGARSSGLRSTSVIDPFVCASVMRSARRHQQRHDARRNGLPVFGLLDVYSCRP